LLKTYKTHSDQLFQHSEILSSNALFLKRLQRQWLAPHILGKNPTKSQFIITSSGHETLSKTGYIFYVSTATHLLQKLVITNLLLRI